MPFYNCGEWVGDDPYEVHSDMSDEDRRAVIYDFIMERYTLDEIADDLATGDLDTDRNELTLRALDYIRGNTTNGSGPDFGGYTWSDEDPDEYSVESDSSAASVRTAPPKKKSSKKATSKKKPAAKAGTDAKPAKSGTSYDVTDGSKTYGTFSSQAKAEALKRQLKAQGVTARVRTVYVTPGSATRRRRAWPSVMS